MQSRSLTNSFCGARYVLHFTRTKKVKSEIAIFGKRRCSKFQVFIDRGDDQHTNTPVPKLQHQHTAADSQTYITANWRCTARHAEYHTASGRRRRRMTSRLQSLQRQEFLVVEAAFVAVPDRAPADE